MICNECIYWEDEKCWDIIEWVNKHGESVCRYQQGAISKLMDCPFCGDTGFDAIGLKCHLLSGGMFYKPCEVFINTPIAHPVENKD